MAVNKNVHLMTKKRFEEIDILKALGIICMVMGHSSSPFHDFIYLFHMAVFFMASGFFFKNTHSDSFGHLCKSIISKIKTLWLTYVIWNTIFIFLHNRFIVMNIYTDNPAIHDYLTGRFIHTMAGYDMAGKLHMLKRTLFFEGGEEMFGASWFLQILFLISVLYLLINYIGQKFLKDKVLILQFVVSIALLVFGFHCSTTGWSKYGFDKAASFYCLYFIGVVLGACREIVAKWNYKIFLPAFIISAGLLKFLETIGTMELAANSYINPAFLIIASLLGWIMLYSLAYFMKQVEFIKTVFMTIGQHTLAVLILHFLAMKLVNAIAVTIDGLPTFCIAAFPNYNGDIGLWWLLYTVVGVGIPVLLDIGYQKIILSIKSVIKNKIALKNPS